MTTAPTTTPKPKRRWLQFSLRTLMVVMVVFGTGLGWFAPRSPSSTTAAGGVEGNRTVAVHSVRGRRPLASG